MRSVVVGTAGHVDHGKSALVQALTGTNPDRLPEEQARGITIELGFAHLVLGDVRYGFVDVPGHERFVKHMLAGAGGIDVVVLVVAADESVMPQTREHFHICRLLRVPAGLVAITKTDLVDAETVELVRLEVAGLVKGSFLEGAPMVPVSARTGFGLDALRAALVEVGARTVERAAAGPARLPIDRVFSIRGFGTVVTGTLVSGHIDVDDELGVAPGGRLVKARGVQVHGARVTRAVAGQRTAVNLGGVEVADLERGQSLVEPGAFQETRVADLALETLADARPLKHGTRVRVHQGTAEILARVAILGAVPTLAPGSRGFVRLRLERPMVLTRGDRCILRAYSPPSTIAGGDVLDPEPPRTAIRNTAVLDRCRQLQVVGPGGHQDASEQAAAVMLEEAGSTGFGLRALTSRLAVAPAAIEAFAERLKAKGVAARVGDVLVAPAVLDRLARGIAGMLDAHHRAQPLSEGMPREEVREKLMGRTSALIFERVLDDLAAKGVVVGRDRLSLAGHRLVLSSEEERARAAIEHLFRDAGLRPPDVASLPSAAGVAPAVVDRMVKLLQRQKVLVPIEGLLFHEDALARLKAEVAAYKASAGDDARLDIGSFKARFGVTRKFAIPLLEYLDRERITRRSGDVRVVL